MGDLDHKMKTIVSEAPQDFVTWLIGNANYKAEYSPRFASRDVESDILLLIELNGEQCLLHIEFQKRRHFKMAYRLWEYNTLATQKYGFPVYSIVIYLQKDNGLARSPYTVEWPLGEIIHSFQFKVITMWNIRAEELFGLGLKGLLPLIPLTEGGNKRESVKRVIHELAPEGEEPDRELLSLAYGFASLALEDERDKDWLRRTFRMLKDILKDTWAFQELMQEGREVGRQEGREVGRQEGRQEGQEAAFQQALEAEKQTLLFYIRTRFPALTPFAEQQSMLLKTPDAMQALMRNIILSQNEEEVHLHLSEVSKK